jgi:hypothetical protein
MTEMTKKADIATDIIKGAVDSILELVIASKQNECGVNEA